jgi:Arc/MetJ-type ribon-helix-helix transcriptional regulator
MKHRLLTHNKSIRLPPDDAAWLERVSVEARRSEGEVMRFALRSLRASMERNNQAEGLESAPMA